MLDFFRGEEASSVDLSGFEYVISITAIDEVVHFRVYRFVELILTVVWKGLIIMYTSKQRVNVSLGYS